MKRNLLSISTFILILFIFSMQVASTQPQRGRLTINEEQIEESIERFERISRKKIESKNLIYIKENFSSYALMAIINEWERTHNLYLEKDAKSNLLIDYLNSEFEFISKGEPLAQVREAGQIAMTGYLASIEGASDIEPIGYRMNELMETGYEYDSAEPNVYGNIYISSNPENARVEFNGEERGRTNNKWVLVIGEYSLSIKKKEYYDHNTKIIIKQGENQRIHCELKKKK
ncbi:MAG: PEGA domain-containing protein [bacterium]|nr:MAG: PEGA domain-containing protein [bacterium]